MSLQFIDLGSLIQINSLSIQIRELMLKETHRLHSEGRTRISTQGS